jgi:hypothetical protein
MAVLNVPKYLSFDHLYVETVTVTNPANLVAGVASNRFVTRTGAYPAAGAYAAGVSLYDIYGPGILTGSETLTLTGTVAIANTGVVTGVGTAFTTELAVGSIVRVEGVDYLVKVITSATEITVERSDGGVIPTVTAGKTAVRLEAKGGYQIEGPSSLSLEYESRFNASTTPFAPRVFPYQKNLSVVTAGIAIVQLVPSATITVDAPVYAAANGFATPTAAGGNVILGRSLDNLVTQSGDIGYIRVRLAGVAN